MKVQFDIAYRSWIESGEYKVVTRNDKPVRIVCWDYKTGEGEDYNIIGLVEGREGEEFLAYYNNKGRYSHYRETAHDLFVIIPESELTDLERAIKRGMLCAGAEGVSTTIIKETAKEVRDIICRGCTVSIDSYIKGREDARKEAERSYTFHYDTYQPPCFHGGVCTNPMRDCINCPMHSSGTTTNTTSGTCKKED